jgi:hypothetical protein
MRPWGQHAPASLHEGLEPHVVLEHLLERPAVVLLVEVALSHEGVVLGPESRHPSSPGATLSTRALAIGEERGVQGLEAPVDGSPHAQADGVLLAAQA